MGQDLGRVKAEESTSIFYRLSWLKQTSNSWKKAPLLSFRADFISFSSKEGSSISEQVETAEHGEWISSRVSGPLIPCQLTLLCSLGEGTYAGSLP